MRALLVVACLSCASISSTALAGPREVGGPGAASRDAYIQRRPTSPPVPPNPELRALIARAEQRSETKALEAV